MHKLSVLQLRRFIVREADAMLAAGDTIGQIVQRQRGGQENAPLQKFVADLSVDNTRLKEIAEGTSKSGAEAYAVGKGSNSSQRREF